MSFCLKFVYAKKLFIEVKFWTIFVLGQEATDQWYSEVKQHTFGGEPSSLSTGTTRLWDIY
jgi:hypothetical protein